MEQLTKRILAIVLIAVIGVGVGITVWIFVSPYNWGAKDCPGLEDRTDITADQIIKIGVCGDLERIQGEGQENGAYLAAYEINTAGGINIGGTTYYIGITSENTDEANPILNTATAVAAAQRLINYKRVQFATGGFRTEALAAYRDLFMEEEIIFINTGAAPSSWCQSVLDDYDFYKYFFQPNPINTTALAAELITLILTTSYVLSQGVGHNITRFSFMREDLEWTKDFQVAMTAVLTNVTGDVDPPLQPLIYTDTDIAFPQDVTPSQMVTYWNWIDGNNTQIVIPIISGTAGLTFANSYGDEQPACVPIGINVLAQDADFWDDTNGRCEYGVTLESVFETNKTSKTLVFWNNYLGNFSISPIYTATGSYDAINQLAWAINQSQSLNPDTVVAAMETITVDNPLEGAGGYGAYDSSHCIVEGWPFGTALAIQWYGGSKTMVPGVGIYPSGVYYPALQNMSPFQLPSWGIYYYD
jgi:hypothetical protein